jgi:2-polyprenyl-6-methoxyphenol hydroxylase-like FAD-dependent oxidoreductase
MNIIVVGAGIGGLAFALSAHRLGLSVRLYESVARLLPLGVGINLQPNAVRELTELGLGDMLAKTGIPTAELAYYSKLGQRIWSEPRGVAAGYKWPQYSIHRGALQLGLLEAVRERLGPHAVTTGHHLHDFERDGTSIRARFVDRATETALATVEADVLIGADGIHSMVRKTLYPDEGPPKYGKWVLFRGAVKSDPFLSGKTMVSVGTRDQRVVAYPISREALDRGKALINWVASLPMPTTGVLPPEEWNRKVGKELFLPEFESWRFPWLDVAGLLEQTADIYQFPFVDREPIPKWSVGRVTLLGDAAHPMYPIGSQAGSQAIIDARVLASALAAFEDPAEALQCYEDTRMAAMNTLVVKNRELGAESVLQIVEDRAPNGFSRLEDVISRTELEETAIGFKKLAGIDVEAVNNREPYFGMT